LPSLNEYEQAVAIVFDFMIPVLAFRWLIHQRRKLWLDESEPGGFRDIDSMKIGTGRATLNILRDH
jgi:hypothetical protein